MTKYDDYRQKKFERECIIVGGFTDEELTIWDMQQNIPYQNLAIFDKWNKKDVEYLKKFNLSDKQIKCFILHYYQELSHRQVAEILQISQPTVTEHLKYALKKLKNTLSKKRR